MSSHQESNRLHADTERSVEEALQQRCQRLEQLLREGAAALTAAQEQLGQEVGRRQQAEAVLEQSVEARTQELQAKTAQLEAALQQVQDMQQQVITQQKLASLGALTAGIAHEIRNPLNFVNNFADLSIELVQELREELTAQQHRFDADTFAEIEDIFASLDLNVQKIMEHGKRADRIVNGMLQHSRGQKGVHEPTDLNALLDEYVQLAYHGIRAQHTEFNSAICMDLDPKLGVVDVVPHDISRVFLNVVNNAFYEVDKKRQALGEGFAPQVMVRTVDYGDRVEISIRDNGNGIPPEIREKMFQPFFTTKATDTGAGLGLSISHDIVVREHHGELRVATEVGQYAEFIITLPKKTP